MTELVLSALSRQRLDCRIGSRAKVEREVAAWQVRRNASAVDINWRLPTSDARIKL